VEGANSGMRDQLSRGGRCPKPLPCDVHLWHRRQDSVELVAKGLAHGYGHAGEEHGREQRQPKDSAPHASKEPRAEGSTPVSLIMVTRPTLELEETIRQKEATEGW